MSSNSAEEAYCALITLALAGIVNIECDDDNAFVVSTWTSDPTGVVRQSWQGETLAEAVGRALRGTKR